MSTKTKPTFTIEITEAEALLVGTWACSGRALERKAKGQQTAGRIENKMCEVVQMAEHRRRQEPVQSEIPD